MAVLEVTTTAANSVWKSPDGQREIFEVALDYKGAPFKAKTYSKDISTVGWAGEVESYEKEGKAGMPVQTFVKQPQKEKFVPKTQAGGKFGNDQFTMYLSYAKDLAIACLTPTPKGGVFNDVLFAEMLGVVEAGGAQLYAARPGAPQEQPTETPKQVSEGTEGGDDSGQLSAVFGDVEELGKDGAWKPSS